MESGPEGTRANGHANGDKKHASETETAQMEEYLKRTTPQALLEHMKLYGCFDQLRSALTKELIDSGVQARLLERARATVESTRAYAHAPPFDPAMTTTKRLQHRKAVLSRILDELHRTSLHKEIEKGIQGVVQDPSSAFHTLAHAQINDALESMRSSTGKRKDSEAPAQRGSSSSLNHNQPPPIERVVDGTPSQLLDEMLGAGRRKVEGDQKASLSTAAAAAKRKRGNGDEEADSEGQKAEPNIKDEGGASASGSGEQRPDDDDDDDERDPKRQKKGHSESESSEDDSSASSSPSSSSSSQPSSPAAKPSSRSDDESSDEEDDKDEEGSRRKADRKKSNVDDDDSEEEARSSRTKKAGRKTKRTIQRASSSDSSSSSDEKEEKNSSDDDDEEEEDSSVTTARRRESRKSLSSRRRRESRSGGRKAKRSRRGSDARSTEEDDAALARRLAEEESARLYPLRRRASRGR